MITFSDFDEYVFCKNNSVTSGGYIDRLTLNLLKHRQEIFFFYLSFKPRPNAFEPLPVERNGQISCHADARHRIPAHF